MAARKNLISQWEREQWRRVFGMLPHGAFDDILSDDEKRKVAEIKKNRETELSQLKR